MSDFGNDFVVLTDEEGNEEEFEHLDTLEQNGQTYMAFVPAQTDLDNDEEELVILKLVNEGTPDEALATIDDEAELQDLFAQFLERIQEDDLYGEDGIDEGDSEEDV